MELGGFDGFCAMGPGRRKSGGGSRVSYWAKLGRYVSLVGCISVLPEREVRRGRASRSVAGGGSSCWSNSEGGSCADRGCFFGWMHVL